MLTGSVGQCPPVSLGVLTHVCGAMLTWGVSFYLLPVSCKQPWTVAPLQTPGWAQPPFSAAICLLLGDLPDTGLILCNVLFQRACSD